MQEACFSPQAQVLLTGIAGVVQAVIGVLFWGWIHSIAKRAERAEARVDRIEEQRDRAAANFEEALQLGGKAAAIASAGRRAR